jgi:hypothetical protein
MVACGVTGAGWVAGDGVVLGRGVTAGMRLP